jgi:hypothetical protein
VAQERVLCEQFFARASQVEHQASDHALLPRRPHRTAHRRGCDTHQPAPLTICGPNNGLAGRDFESFADLQAHLERWMVIADRRLHGTTHERPIERFEREEKAALKPLPERAIPSRERSVTRRVANDSLVDVDTVRYSVPYQLVGKQVDVLVSDYEVRIFDGAQLVASHRRSVEPHSTVQDPLHIAGLWRLRGGEALDTDEEATELLGGLGRTLDDYAALVEGGGR